MRVIKSRRFDEVQFLHFLNVFTMISSYLSYQNISLPRDFYAYDFSRNEFSLLRGFQSSIDVARGVKSIDEILGPDGEEFAGLGLIVNSSMVNAQICKRQLWGSIILGDSFRYSSARDDSLRFAHLQDCVLQQSYILGGLEFSTITSKALADSYFSSTSFLRSSKFTSLKYSPQRSWNFSSNIIKEQPQIEDELPNCPRGPVIQFPQKI